MKFGLLTLFDHYPEDCSEQQYCQHFLDEATYADALGFDSVWIGEHHFDRYICPAPQIIAAAIAQRTTKIRIGTAIVLLPHHNTIRLAENYAMVDLLSGGRLDFSVGRGFLEATYDGFNQAMGESRERFQEGLEMAFTPATTVVLTCHGPVRIFESREFGYAHPTTAGRTDTVRRRTMRMAIMLGLVPLLVISMAVRGPDQVWGLSRAHIVKPPIPPVPSVPPVTSLPPRPSVPLLPPVPQVPPIQPLPLVPPRP